MPARASRRCSHGDCDNLAPCPTHTPKPWASSTRPSSTRASRKVRAAVLERNPVCTCHGCTACTSSGCTKPSTIDDHAVNLAAGGSEHERNHRGVCQPCHDVKTQAEAAEGRRQAR